MSRSVELVRLIAGTDLGKRIEVWMLRVFGKDVIKVSSREVERLGVELSMSMQQAVKLVIAGVLNEALRIHPTLLARHPKVLGKVDAAVFAELIQVAMARGNRSFEALRGLLVERLLRTLPEFDELMKTLDLALAAANKRARGWGPATVVSGVVDGEGKEIGDLLVISTHKDGRVWIMSVLESKSISNTKDLVNLADRAVGQHLWDFARARSRGVSIDGKFVKPSKVVMEPVPVVQRTGGAVIDAKATAERARQMTRGLYTEFVGFAPREMTNGELRRIAAQGIQLEIWRWPFTIDEFSMFQRDLVDLLGKALPDLVVTP